MPVWLVRVVVDRDRACAWVLDGAVPFPVRPRRLLWRDGDVRPSCGSRCAAAVRGVCSDAVRLRLASLPPAARLVFAVLRVRVGLQARQPLLRVRRVRFSSLIVRVLWRCSVRLVRPALLGRGGSRVCCFERRLFGLFVLGAVVFSRLRRCERLAPIGLRRRRGVCGCFEPAGPHLPSFLPPRDRVRVWPPGFPHRGFLPSRVCDRRVCPRVRVVQPARLQLRRPAVERA